MPALLDSPWIHGSEACVDGGSSVGVIDSRENRLLTLLPAAVASRLKPHLEPVRLARKDVLFRAHEPLTVAYFPCGAVVSFVFRLESGETLDVGFVGRDGLAGTAVFPGVATMSCDGIVLVPGLAMRISADVLRRELLANETLYSTIGRFAQVLLPRLVLDQRQVGRDEARAKARAVLFVDQAAVSTELAETDLIENWNGLHFAGAVVMGDGRISHVADMCGKRRGDFHPHPVI